MRLALAAAALSLAALVIDLFRARRRFGRWPLLSPGTGAPTEGVHFLAAPGVQLSVPLQQAAAAHLFAHDLEAVDLVPADLPVAACLEIASLMDPQALAGDPFARSAGAGHAVAVRDTLLRRAGISAPADAAATIAAAEQLRKLAVLRTGSAIAPGFPAISEKGAGRGAILRARAGFATGPRLYVEFVRWALMLVSLVTDPRIGLLLIAITSIAPTLVFAGLPLQPRDRWRSLVLRVPLDFIAWLRACLQPDPRASEIEAARPLYLSMAGDNAPLMSPRRERCPLCGSVELRHHLTTTDLVQRKPGRFSLERCSGCDLIFQNPPLSGRGLAYHYRDFYDGLNAEAMDEVFASTHHLYTSRVEALTRDGSKPRRWLDLGCGYGHFSLAAKRVLPATRFEGLDQSDSVEIAERRGWIDRAWKMSTAELVAAGETFDLVSLFHYLEHTQDPAKEIALAARLVAPGGRVAIEIPNPHCRLGRVLGRWWFPWFQPQHQLFLDEAWVRRLLATAGLHTTSVTYLMTAGDLLLSSLLAVRNACSVGDAPWVRRPKPIRIAVDLLIWAAALPLFLAAIAGDAIYSLLSPSPQTSNAFRVVATRPES